jgi:FtsP/CotA-like multicopper oxidase with cupredoxin domain
MNRDDAASLTDALEDRLLDGLDVDAPSTRRSVLGGLSLAGGAALAGVGAANGGHGSGGHGDGDSAHGNFGAVDEYESNFDPHAFLRRFNTGAEDRDVNVDVYEEGGRTVREFRLVAADVDVEVAPGVSFPAWTYNGQVPGPTLRVEEGDLVRVEFVNGSQKHAHTIHPHLKNLDPAMDGVPTNGPGVLDPGESFTYEWQAEPAGVHLYHCHSLPLKAHIHRGLYGALIVDPDPERVREHPREYVNYHGPITQEYRRDLVDRAKSRNGISHPDHVPDGYTDVDEMVMVMNGFDTNFDGDNEVYAANTRAFCYGVAGTDGRGDWEGSGTKRPIRLDGDALNRVYLVNAIEFDPINSFHTHSQFFDYYDHGTTLYPTHKRIDTVMQCQAQRGILEIDYRDHDPGLYMFHAHQSEFAELGWMSFFEVQ